jgi:hypothetical protein
MYRKLLTNRQIIYKKDVMHLEMQDINQKLIYEISKKFRNAIVSIKLTEELQDFSYIKHFPNGCCGVASLMLGAYLQSYGLSEHEYVYGDRNGFSHAWLECKSIIIDITSDQFEDGEEVYIGLRNGFYNSFKQQKRHAWNASLDGKCIESDRLFPLYSAILNIISFEKQPTISIML